jgi:hypothetical protein
MSLPAWHTPGSVIPLLQQETIFSVLITSTQKQPAQPGFIFLN